MSDQHKATSTRRPRVLLVAYCCSPYHGSEAGMGWNFARQMANYCDTWVICEEHKFGGHIRRYLKQQGPVPGLQFEFLAERVWAKAMWSVPGMGYLSYNLWQRRALQAARKLHRRHQFDLAHQVNIIGFREPGYLWRLGIPFVWGPVGGTQNYPWQFLSQADAWGGAGEALRTIANRLQLRYSPRVRQATRKAAAVLTANSTNQRDFAQAFGIQPKLLLETGLCQVRQQVRPRRSPHQPLQIVWSGEFRTWKALQLLLRALGQLPEDVRFQLRVLGAGPLQTSWQRLAQQLGIDQHITWLGWLPHGQAMQQYARADVCVFTSLRDTSGNVVLESLANGLPVLCLDHQGVRDMVSEECGIKIPVTTPANVVAGLRDGITLLARDADFWKRLSDGALLRAQQYLWSRQGARMLEVYRRVLAHDPDCPLAISWKQALTRQPEEEPPCLQRDRESPGEIHFSDVSPI